MLIINLCTQLKLTINSVQKILPARSEHYGEMDFAKDKMTKIYQSSELKVKGTVGGWEWEGVWLLCLQPPQIFTQMLYCPFAYICNEIPHLVTV